MHELLLFASVPAHQHTQLLHILAGIAAMQPVPVIEQHLIFKPNTARPVPGGGGEGASLPRPPTGSGPVTATTAGTNPAAQALPQGDFFYLKLVGELQQEQEGAEAMMEEEEGEKQKKKQPRESTLIGEDGESGRENGNTSSRVASKQQYTMQFRDIPEVAGRRPVTSRLMADVQITSDDPFQSMADMDYT